MWPNNGFSNNGPPNHNGFPHFNQDEVPSPFATGMGGFMPQGNMNPFDNVQSDDYTPGGFQADNIMYNNQAAFQQNQFPMMPNQAFSPAPFIPSPANGNMAPATPATPRIQQQVLNAKAAELKEKLLKQKGEKVEQGRASPAISRTTALPKPAAPVVEPTSSVQAPPQTPATKAEPGFRDQDIHDLIAAYSDKKTPADADVQMENDGLPPVPAFNQASLPPAKSHQGPSLGSPTKVVKSHVNGKNGDSSSLSQRESRHASGDMSDGEIPDEPEQKKLPPTEPKGDKVHSQITTNADKSRKAIDDTMEAPRPSNREQLGDNSLPRRPPPGSNDKSEVPRHREERKDSKDEQKREERRGSKDDRNMRYESSYYRGDRRGSRDEQDYRGERRSYPDQEYERKFEPKKKSCPRKDMWEQKEDHRRPDSRQNREDPKAVKGLGTKPTLDQFLEHDPELKEWLEYTQYHNEEHKEKVLQKHRALKALEAQKEQLLAEIRNEQFVASGFQLAPTPQPQDTTTTKKEIIEAPSGSLRDRITSNKRAHSEEPEGDAGKMARFDDRPRRIKDEEEEYRARSSYGGSGGAYRPYGDDQDRGRNRSRERNMSPGRRAFDTRSNGRYFEDNGGDDIPERFGGRPSRGDYGNNSSVGYRGGRGGRGRGFYRGSHEARGDYGGRKTYKDSKGFDRGGRGGQ